MPADSQLTEAQRSAAIESVGENVALRSGAGCGKTFVLARRFLQLLQDADGDQQPDQADEVMSRLVALTFTNKAALEMSSRVRSMLDERARQAQGAERRRLLAWLDQMPEARINTIDGFCASLLRAHAVEAGVDPSFAVGADNLLTSRMLADAAEQAVLQAVESQDKNLAELLSEMNFEQVVSLVQELMDNRLACDLGALGDSEAIVERWREAVDASRTAGLKALAEDSRLRAEVEEIASIRCENSSDKLAIFRQEQLEVVQTILKDPSNVTAKVFEGLATSAGSVGSAKAWGSKEVLMDLRRRLKGMLATVGDYAEYFEELGSYDIRAADGLATLAKLAMEAGQLYAAEKRTRGLLDFTDLLDHANRLLSGNAELRKTLGEGIDQLLIDECQDTNRFQLETLAMLIGGGTPEKAPPEGKLFAVGDAKQSIYRFRGAQVEVFGRMCKRLGTDRQKYLETSFRTHQAGVEFINALFAPLMGADFAPTEAFRKTSPEHPSVEFILASGQEGSPIDSAADSAAAQAEVCAGRIEEILRGKEKIVWDGQAESWRAARPGDIAILFARMTNSLTYERALQQRNIPYYVVAGTGFFQRQEVFDIMTALAAVDNPHDDIALMGTLRGGLIGLSDNALMHIAQACEPPYYMSLLESDLSERLGPVEAEALAAALGLIGRLHAIKDALAIDEVLHRLLDATGYEATLLSCFQGRRMLSNVRQVAQRAEAAAADHIGLADFLSEMRRQVAEQSRYEQAAVAGEGENVVRLMTIHKAKGLEFPVVVIPDLNAGRRGRTGKLLIRDDWGPTFNRPASPDDDENAIKPLSYRLACRLEDADSQAEDIRRLYVAATRHEDHLIFVGADWRNKDGALRDSHSYIAQMDEVLHLTEAIEASGGEIPYGDGRFRAAARNMTPPPPAQRTRPNSAGHKILNSAPGPAELGQRIIQASPSPPELPLVGPLPPASGQIEIAVTALNDFETCPMLYRWRHELRLPRRYEYLMRLSGAEGTRAEPQPAANPSALDAATTGTLYHKCMELLDFDNPQNADVLLRQAADLLDIEAGAGLEALAAELSKMLASLAENELWAELKSATQVRRELDFVLQCPPAIVRGQIDLAYKDQAGMWHIVDYKSDRVEPGPQVAERAAHYELQLLLYAQAAGRHFDGPVADAKLYFLRPARTYEFRADADALSEATHRASNLAQRLIESRRSGVFERLGHEKCARCSYSGLCGTAAGEAAADKNG